MKQIDNFVDWLYKQANQSIQVPEKFRIYVSEDDGESAPEGVMVHDGPQGGSFYDARMVQSTDNIVKNIFGKALSLAKVENIFKTPTKLSYDKVSVLSVNVGASSEQQTTMAYDTRGGQRAGSRRRYGVVQANEKLNQQLQQIERDFQEGVNPSDLKKKPWAKLATVNLPMATGMREDRTADDMERIKQEQITARKDKSHKARFGSGNAWGWFSDAEWSKAVNTGKFPKDADGEELSFEDYAQQFGGKEKAIALRAAAKVELRKQQEKVRQEFFKEHPADTLVAKESLQHKGGSVVLKNGNKHNINPFRLGTIETHISKMPNGKLSMKYVFSWTKDFGKIKSIDGKDAEQIKESVRKDYNMHLMDTALKAGVDNLSRVVNKGGLWNAGQQGFELTNPNDIRKVQKVFSMWLKKKESEKMTSGAGRPRTTGSYVNLTDIPQNRSQANEKQRKRGIYRDDLIKEVSRFTSVSDFANWNPTDEKDPKKTMGYQVLSGIDTGYDMSLNLKDDDKKKRFRKFWMSKSLNDITFDENTITSNQLNTFQQWINKHFDSNFI